MKQKFHMGTGTVSLLMIAVLFCFATFSVLSLVSARADSRLTQKTMEATAAYYHAEGLAQERLAQIDAALQQGESPLAVKGVEEQDGGYSFLIPVEGGKQLVIAFTVEDGRYQVYQHRLEPSETWQVEEEEPALWDGQ